VRDDIFPTLTGKVTGEQHKGNISNLALASLDSGNVLQLQGRVISEQHLGRVLDRSFPGIHKFLSL
jgi:hypothetical protein